jgi:NAD(P)-dependent dehydrogenase (short-subunit alcohol dehydrogenase family)
LQESIDALKEKCPSVDYRALEINLSSQKSVRAAAAELLSWSDVPAIDILVDSAGVMDIPERTLSEDGIEIHFDTNYIGHYLFACLIMPKLIEAARKNRKGETRIVNVSSLSPQWTHMRWSDTNFNVKSKDLPEEERSDYSVLESWGNTDVENKSYVPIEGYNQSKVANVLFSIKATNRLYEKCGILSLAVHPGVIKTELGRSSAPETDAAVKAMMKKGIFSWMTLNSGASCSLVAALDPKLGPPEAREGKKENYGAYLVHCQISDIARPLAVSSAEAEK